jgi:hypothetical protein
MLDAIKNYFKTFNIAQKLDDIKNFFSATYDALQKVQVFISYLQDELQKNNVGSNILKMLPSLVSVIGTIVSLIAKFGPLFGLQLPVSAPSPKKATYEEVCKDLDDALNKLKKVG